MARIPVSYSIRNTTHARGKSLMIQASGINGAPIDCHGRIGAYYKWNQNGSARMLGPLGKRPNGPGSNYSRLQKTRYSPDSHDALAKLRNERLNNTS